MNVPDHNGPLKCIAAKAEAGERLTREDGVRLYASRDIHEIGRLANLVRERLHGDAAYYNVNRHINYTNYCVLRCKFCSFYRPYPKARQAEEKPEEPRASARAASRSESPPRRGDSQSSPSLPVFPAHDAEAYDLSVEEIVALARSADGLGATEVHIVGGLHPKRPLSYYLDMCRAIRGACPRIHVKAFTAVEIIHFARVDRPRRSITEVLEQVHEAGLNSLPGGGAEIFDDRVHDEAYRSKVGEQGWFDVHRAAHALGIPSNATMLYGHVERPDERINHMIKLRGHQDRSLRECPAAFNCFVPLSFRPEGSALQHLHGPTGLDDLKTLAISRLMLDNFPHIKAFWIMQSAKLAQVSLNWGVDDVDGTVVYYDITKGGGGVAGRHQEMTVEQIRRLIREAGRVPVERDSLYREVIRAGAAWRVGEPVVRVQQRRQRNRENPDNL